MRYITIALICVIMAQEPSISFAQGGGRGQANEELLEAAKALIEAQDEQAEVLKKEAIVLKDALNDCKSKESFPKVYYILFGTVLGIISYKLINR